MSVCVYGCVEIGLGVWRERWVCGVCIARLCMCLEERRGEWEYVCRDGVVWRE